MSFVAPILKGEGFRHLARKAKDWPERPESGMHLSRPPQGEGSTRETGCGSPRPLLAEDWPAPGKTGVALHGLLQREIGPRDLGRSGDRGTRYRTRKPVGRSDIGMSYWWWLIMAFEHKM